MVIPYQLVLLLERLFGTKVKGGGIYVPYVEERICIYLQALEYVEKDLRLFTYVLGHRLIVAELGCTIVDDILLDCMCRDPKIIPSDFRQRMPKGLLITEYAERLYMRDKEYKTLTPQTEQVFQMAAE